MREIKIKEKKIKDVKKRMKQEKIKGVMQIINTILLFCISIISSSLHNQEYLFYNIIIIPCIGVIGYTIFQKSAIYKTSILFSCTHLFMNAVHYLQKIEYFGFLDFFINLLLYLVFLMLGIFIAWLFDPDKCDQKYKILCYILGTILCIGVLFLFSAFHGNFISRNIAKNNAIKYVKKEYPALNFKLNGIGYNFKDAEYFLHFGKEYSSDQNFTLTYDNFGKLKSNDYEDRIIKGSNVKDRLWKQYRLLTDTIFQNPSFPYHGDIMFGDLDLEKAEEIFIPDKMYDIDKLAERYGKIVIYVKSDNVTKEYASEIMKDIKEIFDETGTPFAKMDFVLQDTKDSKKEIRKENVQYKDI